MKKIIINEQEYEILKNEKETFDLEIVKEKFTNYFEPYEYILGDMSYGKVRLKGFYDEKNKKVTEINNINKMDEYLKDYCAFNCGYFLLKKVLNK